VGLSLLDQPADSQCGRTGRIRCELPVELRLIISPVGIHPGSVAIGEGQDFVDPCRCQLEFLGDRPRRLAEPSTRWAFRMWKSPIRRPTTRISPSGLPCRQEGKSWISD